MVYFGHTYKSLLHSLLLSEVHFVRPRLPYFQSHEYLLWSWLPIFTQNMPLNALSCLPIWFISYALRTREWSSRTDPRIPTRGFTSQEDISGCRLQRRDGSLSAAVKSNQSLAAALACFPLVMRRNSERIIWHFLTLVHRWSNGVMLRWFLGGREAQGSLEVSRCSLAVASCR